ncbi:MAG: response regulator transcription factor [Anaerolineae bacterium]|nr:response regulator transcription factor [Anaerolineae bacterium]
MDSKTILIIDDDISLCQILDITFTVEGAFVITANDGREGLQKFFAHRPDLVVLDVNMPHMDGWETCRQIRLLSDVPIIMLTTLQGDQEMVRGLDAGADDFITKPFNADVLLARTRAVLRRMEKTAVPPTDSQYSDGYLIIHLERHEVLVLGEQVKLTATEFQLLTYFLKNSGHTLTYKQILENIWGWEYQESIDYVHVYVSHLRRKIERDPKNPFYFITVHGIGYRFEKATTG